jgi:hypothetical protein
LKKHLKWCNNKMFDVASGSFMLAFAGIAMVIVVAAVALIVVAVILIRKALKKKEAEDIKKDNDKTQ